MLSGTENHKAPSFRIELELLRQGYELIAGVDEVGRGALAGPLCLGLVIFGIPVISAPPREFQLHINDSKKISPSCRMRALSIIAEYSLCMCSLMVSHKVVDRLNVNGATEYALNRMLETVSLKPDVVIMDGRFVFSCGVPVISQIAGDRNSFSIASASIVAKVRRDEILCRLDHRYPGYCLGKNKGYGTRDHREAIVKNGPCPIHRKSFDPVKTLISQNGLFDRED